MLAQNFKTAAELRIEEDEVAALIKVLGMLERDELRHAPAVDQIRGNSFNMNNVEVVTGCGTAHCIGGWVARFLGKSARSYTCDRAIGPLAKLYWPYDKVHDWDFITPEQAATALRSYLTTGEPRWEEAVA